MRDHPPVRLGDVRLHDERAIGFHTRERILQAAAEVFAERGIAGVCVDDVAQQASCSRASVYRFARGVPDLLLLVVERNLLDRQALLTRAEALVEWRSQRWEELLAAATRRQHERWGALETVLRSQAGSGLPRARSLLARLDLQRHDDAVDVVLKLGRGDADERVHVVQLLLAVEPYVHLCGRCGWSDRAYESWLSGELHRIRRWPSPYS